MSRAVILDRFKFEQIIPDAIWTVQHNLNVSNPVVDVWIKEGSSTKYKNSDAHRVIVLDSTHIQIEFDNIPRTGLALIT